MWLGPTLSAGAMQAARMAPAQILCRAEMDRSIPIADGRHNNELTRLPGCARRTSFLDAATRSGRLNRIFVQSPRFA